MAGLAGTYHYVLLKLGPLTVTRKGLNLAVRHLSFSRSSPIC